MSKKHAFKIPTWLIVTLSTIILLGGGGYLWYRSKTVPSKYDALTQCLTKKGVKMFGAYWCPVCQKQKKTLGNSWRYIKYIECSLPNATGQTKQCKEAGIESYPTWEFADGERVVGELFPAELAERSGCIDKLP